MTAGPLFMNALCLSVGGKPEAQHGQLLSRRDRVSFVPVQRAAFCQRAVAEDVFAIIFHKDRLLRIRCGRAVQLCFVLVITVPSAFII